MRLGRFFLLCGLIGLAPAEAVRAQPAAPATAAGTSNRIALPEPPSPKSPIESFRNLLKMDETARQKLLAEKSPQYRQNLEAKLKEYLVLPPDERELRLKLVELRWYLTPLMRLPPSQRAASLALVPAADRPLIEDRLKQW